jgi:phosphoglycerol transferase MdoB-like AlkP superfamily enzyme
MSGKSVQRTRYGKTFFVLCVVVAVWQCLAFVADLRVLGREPQEWLMAPLTLVNAYVFASPFNGLMCLLNDRTSGIGMYPTILITIANILLILSPYWLLKRRWRWLVWIPMTLLTIWFVMQLCYCRAYDDLMPWQSLTLTENVNNTLANSTISLMRWHDLLVVLPFLALIVVCWRGNKEREDKRRLKPFLVTLLACLLASVMGYANFNENYEKRFLHNFSNKGYFSQNGMVPYGVFTLYQVFFNSHSVTDDDRAMLDRFLEEDCPHYTDNSYCSKERRNLVLIIVESLHTWPIGMEVDGHEVSPVLNSLVAGDSVIYAPHVLFQTSHGHSSDAHFIYNTGLLPLRDAAVAVNHGGGHYPTLAAALEGYDCREVICTPGMNWNQTVTSRTYGFDSLYTRDQLIDAGLLARHAEIDDAALTDFAGRLLPQMRQPFFIEMVTMTMHVPFSNGNVRPSWITASDTLNADARAYLNCVNITDSCIGAFFDELRRCGLDRNTIVAIVSDHTQIYRNRIEGRSDYEFVPNDWGIPLIIAGCDTTLRYEPVIGQVDVYPTLLDVMGANHYYWKGLGHSILRYPVTGAIQPRNMSVIGDSTALTPHQRRAWDISRLIIFDGGLKGSASRTQ